MVKLFALSMNINYMGFVCGSLHLEWSKMTSAEPAVSTCPDTLHDVSTPLSHHPVLFSQCLFRCCIPAVISFDLIVGSKSKGIARIRNTSRSTSECRQNIWQLHHGVFFVESKIKWSIIGGLEQDDGTIQERPKLLERVGLGVLSLSCSVFQSVKQLPFPFGSTVRVVEDVIGPPLQPLVTYVKNQSLNMLSYVDDQVFFLHSTGLFCLFQI